MILSFFLFRQLMLVKQRRTDTAWLAVFHCIGVSVGDFFIQFGCYCREIITKHIRDRLGVTYILPVINQECYIIGLISRSAKQSVYRPPSLPHITLKMQLIFSYSIYWDRAFLPVSRQSCCSLYRPWRELSLICIS